LKLRHQRERDRDGKRKSEREREKEKEMMTETERVGERRRNSLHIQTIFLKGFQDDHEGVPLCLTETTILDLE
jgi:hypothetical protein